MHNNTSSAKHQARAQHAATQASDGLRQFVSIEHSAGCWDGIPQGAQVPATSRTQRYSWDAGHKQADNRHPVRDHVCRADRNRKIVPRRMRLGLARQSLATGGNGGEADFCHHGPAAQLHRFPQVHCAHLLCLQEATLVNKQQHCSMPTKPTLHLSQLSTAHPADWSTQGWATGACNQPTWLALGPGPALHPLWWPPLPRQHQCRPGAHPGPAGCPQSARRSR